MTYTNPTIRECSVRSVGMRFSKVVDGVEVGHAYLYLMWNDLHPDRPFGLIEDVEVIEAHRLHIHADELLSEAIRAAEDANAYKLLATSRTLEASGEDRAHVHSWYESRGFKKWGTEFRMDIMSNKERVAGEGNQ